MMINKLRLKAMTATAGLLLAGAAQAGLIGDSVGIRYVGAGGDTGVQTSTVGAGEEGNFFGNQFYDFGDTDFGIRSLGSYCGVFLCSGESISLRLSDLDFGAALTNVIFSTNLSGVSMAFTADSVSFSWGEQSISNGTYLRANFETGSRVPEPSTLALMGLAIAGLGLAKRRKSEA